MYNKLHVLLSNLLHVSVRSVPSSGKTFLCTLKTILTFMTTWVGNSPWRWLSQRRNM